jgi:hypothetical protein
MPAYRIYTLDDDGHIVGPPAVIDCPDDQAAIQEAKRTLDGKVIELWDGPRQIAKLAPMHK